MKRLEEKYWMIIPPYCYISLKKNKVLIYDTLSSKSFYYNNAAIATLARELLNPNNSYCILISNKELNDPPIKKMIDDLRSSHMVDLLDFELIASKPYHLLPQGYFEKTFRIENENNNRDYKVNFDLPSLVKSIDIQLTNNCELDCRHCHAYFKQFSFCHKSKICSELKIDALLNLLEQIKGLGIAEIVFTGGNMRSYRDLGTVLNFLKSIENKSVFKINSKQLKTGFEAWIHSLIDNVDFEIIFVEIVNKEEFKRIIPLLGSNFGNVRFEFIVEDELSGKVVDEILKEFPSINYKITPFYNGNNMGFFEKFVFLNQLDLNEIEVSMREILVSKEMNKMFFGKLFLLSNGDLYSNLNFPAIGNVFSDDLGQLIIKELYNKNSPWYLTRATEICRNCVYENICPSVSNYEIIMDRETACLT